MQPFFASPGGQNFCPAEAGTGVVVTTNAVRDASNAPPMIRMGFIMMLPFFDSLLDAGRV
jgi:hypothetical protein